MALLPNHGEIQLRNYTSVQIWAVVLKIITIRLRFGTETLLFLLPNVLYRFVNKSVKCCHVNLITRERFLEIRRLNASTVVYLETVQAI